MADQDPARKVINDWITLLLSIFYLVLFVKMFTHDDLARARMWLGISKISRTVATTSGQLALHAEHEYYKAVQR